MAISEATVRTAHLYPELIPDTAVVTIAAGAEAVPPILSLRRFSPLFLHLKAIAVARVNTTELRILADNVRAAIVAGTLTGNPNAALGGITSNPFDILARESLYFNLFSTPGVATTPTYYGLWIYPPTVAHKLKLGMSLNEEEKKLNRDLDIQSTVEKGLLPLPISQQIEREYQVINEMTYGRILTIPVAPGVVVDTLHPRVQDDEFIVLTTIATTPGVPGSVFLTIDRDDDAGYVPVIPTFPLSLDFDLPCFIPALKEIRISLLAVIGAPVANFTIRYTVLRCKLNTIMRARWGLASKDELPGDVYNKVKGGVL
jgi:hypothetical protein